MTPMLLLTLALCMLGILGSGLYSGAETGAYTFNRTRHRLQLAEGMKRAFLVQSLTADMTGFVVVCLIGTNLANALVAQSATLALEHFTLPNPNLLSTITVAPILFMLGELLPKELFRRHADRLIYTTAPILRLSSFVLWPATLVLNGLNAMLVAVGLRGEDSGDRFHVQERIRLAVAAGRESGTLSAFQTTLAQNIFSLENRTVAQVMQPLASVDCLEAATDITAARAFVTGRRHTRYPVYRNSRENVVGVVGSYDLVFEERPGLTIRNYLQEPLFLTPRTKVVDALVKLRRARTNMAIVARDDVAVGLVTLKDLVEEITGELTDL